MRTWWIVRWIVIGLMLALPLTEASVAIAADPAPLKILLTNDDGWDAVGIQTMKDALTAAGHDVTLVAPASNRSGSSAALTLDFVNVTQQSTNEYAVDGSPATCALLGLSAILDEPADLLVSGTNKGANVGPSTPFSGTVGATIAAISDVGGRVPAIAFSTKPPVDDEEDPAFTEHFENVAAFAVGLIAHLQSTPGPLLPKRLALNVNYPSLSPEEILGVTINVSGLASDFQLTYAPIAPGSDVFIPVAVPAPFENEVPLSDKLGLEAGFITIVPIDGDYSVALSTSKTVKSLLRGFKH